MECCSSFPNKVPINLLISFFFSNFFEWFAVRENLDLLMDKPLWPIKGALVTRGSCCDIKITRKSISVRTFGILFETLISLFTSFVYLVKVTRPLQRFSFPERRSWAQRALVILNSRSLDWKSETLISR